MCVSRADGLNDAGAPQNQIEGGALVMMAHCVDLRGEKVTTKRH